MAPARTADAGRREGRKGPRSDGRRFLEAIFRVAREGARWSDLPEHRFGSQQTVQRRYYRWIEAGVPDRIAEAIANDAVLKDLIEVISSFQNGSRIAPRERRRGDRKPKFVGDPPGDMLFRPSHHDGS